MSALELNDRGDPSTLSYYAPRRRGIAADGSSIRPVLARLRRKEGGHPLVESVPLMPNDEPLAGADARTRLVLTGARFAAVVALCAGTTTVAYFMQARPQPQAKPSREDRAALPAAAPKPVQTVSFKSQERVGDAGLTPAAAPVSAAETKGRPLNDSAAQVVGSRAAENSAAVPSPPVPLGLMPAALSSAGRSPAMADVPADPEAAGKTQAPASEHESKERHVAHARHHYRHRHHVARVSAPPAADAASAPPAQPSLADLLRKIFKSNPADQTDKPDAGAIR